MPSSRLGANSLGVWGTRLLSLYGLLFFTMFFCVSDQPLGRQGILPLPPTITAVLGLFPFVALALFRDLASYRGSQVRAVLRANTLPLGAFAMVIFFALLLSLLPGAFWEEGAKWIFLLPYGFLITLGAVFVPLAEPMRRLVPVAQFLALALLLGSIIYDTLYPGTFSTELTRAAGFPGNSNFAALVCVVVCAAALDYDGRRPILVDTAFLLVTTFAVLMTMSRSGFVNFFVLILTFVYHRFIRGGIQVRKIVNLCVATFMVAATFAITIPVLMENTTLFAPNTRLGKLMSGSRVDDGSAASRFGAVMDAVRLIDESPILGHGTGHSRTMEELPHNLYLQQWVNNGLPGLLSYLVMLGVTFRTFGKRRYYAGQAFIVAATIGGLFSHNVLDQRPFLLLFGMLLTESWLRQREAANHRAAAAARYADWAVKAAVPGPGSPAMAR